MGMGVGVAVGCGRTTSCILLHDAASKDTFSELPSSCLVHALVLPLQCSQYFQLEGTPVPGTLAVDRTAGLALLACAAHAYICEGDQLTPQEGATGRYYGCRSTAELPEVWAGSCLGKGLGGDGGDLVCWTRQCDPLGLTGETV
jgi:hypothetical protein